MAVQKRIGDADVKAKFAFIAAEPTKFNDRQLYTILRNVIAWEEERIKEGEITEFLAFIENAGHAAAPKARAVTNDFIIDGRLAVVSAKVIQDKIREKLFHMSEGFRKSGQKSTHPPRFLTATTLVFVIGSTRFLMDNVDLYLEREGVLRAEMIDLLKEVATLKPGVHSRHENYYSVDIAHKSFYRGYVEELGRVAGIRPKDEELQVLSQDELVRKLGLQTEG